jgi:hypothetical protein
MTRLEPPPAPLDHYIEAQPQRKMGSVGQQTCGGVPRRHPGAGAPRLRISRRGRQRSPRNLRLPMTGVRPRAPFRATRPSL